VISPTVLLSPSRAAAAIWPRRLAERRGALAGVYSFTLQELARAIAEPVLLGSGLSNWDSGHAALVARRLLAEERELLVSPSLPLGSVAAALARSLLEMRRAGVEPGRIAALAERPLQPVDDVSRLRALARLFAGFQAALERFADPVTLYGAASERLDEIPWLRGAEILITDDLELSAVEEDFLKALAGRFEVSVLETLRSPGQPRPLLRLTGFREAAWSAGLLAPASPVTPPEGIARLCRTLFEPIQGEPVGDGSVELRTAPGEAAEVLAVARCILREAARGVRFDEIGVLLPRPEPYATLLTDQLQRLEIPFQLHPSLPLRHGRCTRSLLLLLRCRGLTRGAVMEFLTFAPIPFEGILGRDTSPSPPRWDEISRSAGVVSGLDRWRAGLPAFAEAERSDTRPHVRERREQRAREAEDLLLIIERLAITLGRLEGEAPWPEWSERIRDIVTEWLSDASDREPLLGVVADLAGLDSAAGARAAPWAEVEGVLAARLEWERLPLQRSPVGAVHLGALDAVAGVPFRVVAIPGLVEGGFPGVLRPDPFLLDPEREALREPVRGAAGAKRGQLSLFDETEPVTSPAPYPLETTQDRLLRERRRFARAIAQAGERLILSYPRADPRSGRERMPSLFFVAAASAREGRPLSVAELSALVQEDALDALPLTEAVDRAERDRIRLAGDDDEQAAELAIAAGSPFFRQSRLASKARWSDRMTPYDGLVADPDSGLRERLDPITAHAPLSASRIATFARCGFLYLLQYVLRLEPALEPEERKRLEPLERGSLFHEVAEEFLRGLRDAGALPVRDTPELRGRLLELADRSLDALVKGSPPRYVLLWERERREFKRTLLRWLEREAGMADRSRPAHFEVGFGPSVSPSPGEPHMREALAIDLGDERVLRLSGKIDRIDRREDGTLVLRDYKTGRAPRDDGGVFRGGAQLQIPFYILAAAELFPDAPVADAFLDYVDGGRQVAVNPETVRSPAFTQLLRNLTDAIAGGVFLQEPRACQWCDYTEVCGPEPLIRIRRQIKIRDARVQQILKLRDFA
jgi:RecB family exonuclease